MPGPDDARFRLLVESIQDYAIFFLDPKGNVASWNEGARRINGYEASEIVGRHFSTFYREEDVVRGFCETELELAQRDGRFEDFGWRVRKDGSQFWANVVITALREHGELIGFGKVTRDVTDRAFRVFVEATNAIVWTTDATGRPNADSPSWRAHTGQSEEAWYGREGWEPVHPDERARLAVAWSDAKAKKTPFRAEFRLRRATGDYQWMAASAVPFLDGDGNVREWFGVTFDISTRVALQEERERLLEAEHQARAAAEQANRAKDEFLAIVSHELRNPLNIILGWTRILAAKELPADLRAPIETIERNTRAQTRLIDDMLDVSRIISGKLHLDVTDTSLNQIVSDAITSQRPLAAAKNVEITSVVEPDLRIRADPVRLQQVISNIVSNAVKFSPAKSHVSLVARRIGDEIEVRVSDDGEGIDPSRLTAIFAPFRQEDPSTTRRHGGLGLGLAIVLELVNAHGGRVRAESEGKGKGATFVIELPLRGPKTHRFESTPAFRHTSTRLDGTCVLLVDDNLDVLELFSTTLRDAGASVETAESSGDAIEKLKHVRPDVIVSDIGMPVVDGYELMRRIRALPLNQGGATPAIALTAYSRTEDGERALAAGFHVHLSKPVDPTHLVATVADIVRKR